MKDCLEDILFLVFIIIIRAVQQKFL